MHVAIKQTILDKLLERIHQIKRSNREPEYIAVTHEEFVELRDDRRVFLYLDYDRSALYAPNSTAAATAQFVTRDFALRDAHRGRSGLCPSIRTYSRETFMGLPLYVVPAEYMPS